MAQGVLNIDKVNNERGFTIPELMIGLVLVGVLVSFAVPSFQGAIKRNRIVTTTNEVLGIMNFARTEAVKRGATVHVGSIALGVTAQETNVSWVVWVDSGSTSNDWDSTDEVLRVWESFPAGVTLTHGDNTQAILTFGASGFSSRAETFTVCDDRVGEEGNRVDVLISGAATRTSVTCS
ncbi:hypothetical protein NBRC116494_08070 [Aurantivibrio plasticivorans]